MIRFRRSKSRGTTKLFGVALLTVFVALTVALTFRGRAVAGVHAAVGVSAPSTCNPSWSSSQLPDVGGADPTIRSVAASSATDAWAVGDALGVSSFLLHWDGAEWQSFPEPDGVLAVAATTIAPNDTWIAGAKFAHWDGSSWSVVPTAAGATTISAVSSDDIWAVSEPNFLHWDGSNWQSVPMPALPGGTDGFLYQIDGISSDDVWAVGTQVSGTATGTLIEHWNGKIWSIVPSPNLTGQQIRGNSLSAVTAVSATDAWTVGATTYQTDPDSDPYTRTLIEHWDGATWSILPSPNSDAIHIDSLLRGVAAVSAGDVWSVGGDGPYILHWDGNSWTRTITPTPANQNFYAVSALKDGSVFAAGTVTASVCEALVSSAGVTPAKSNGTAAGSSVIWHFNQAGRIVDGSGLGLFDSGVRTPGGSYMTRLASAATYQATDTASGESEKVGVGLVVKPTSGAVGTQFGIRWGSDLPLPAGEVTDVQLARPNVPGGWVDWVRGQPAGGASFTPDAGTGTYGFRVRVRNTTTGATSGWSTTRVIHVS